MQSLRSLELQLAATEETFMLGTIAPLLHWHGPHLPSSQHRLLVHFVEHPKIIDNSPIIFVTLSPCPLGLALRGTGRRPPTTASIFHILPTEKSGVHVHSSILTRDSCTT